MPAPAPPTRRVRGLQAWIASALVVGLVGALGTGEDADAGRAAAASAPTTTTVPLPLQAPLIGRPDAGLTQYVALGVDVSTGQANPSPHAAASTRMDGPDGRRVVVEDHSTSTGPRTTCGFAGCSTWSQSSSASDVAVLDADGTRTVLSEGGYDRGAEWSPDGDLIAYVSHRKGVELERDVVLLVTPEGRARGRLTPPGATDTLVTFSADGSHVAIVRTDLAAGDASGTRSEAYVVVVDLATRTERRIATGGFSQLAWSPDGATIAAVQSRMSLSTYDGNRYATPHTDLWLLHADGTPPAQLTAYAPADGGSGQATWCGSSGGLWFRVAAPVWSRDGRLAFLTDHLTAAQHGFVMDVALADLSGAGNHQVVYRSPPATCEGGYGLQLPQPTFLYGWQ